MAAKKILTIFGSTGNQGGNVIQTILSNQSLASKYAIRGITRDPSSKKSQALAEKGVEPVKADVNDPASIEAAVKDAYGVFAMTDYWSILDKALEIKQGKSIFEACKKSGVKHLIWSSLPYVTKLSDGKYKGVAHFDSKAEVEEYIEANKGDMIVSYFLPAMFMDAAKQVIQPGEDGKSYSISLPFPDQNIPWPLLSPSRDSGKYVVGLFEAGASANGVEVQGVSEWCTPTQVAKQLEEKTGKKTTFNSIPSETFESYLPENIREDMGQMMSWMGDSGYYGKGRKEKQPESDKFLLPGSKLTKWEEFVELEFK